VTTQQTTTQQQTNAYAAAAGDAAADERKVSPNDASRRLGSGMFSFFLFVHLTYTILF
jgi:hypothetical protein